MFPQPLVLVPTVSFYPSTLLCFHEWTHWQTQRHKTSGYRQTFSHQIWSNPTEIWAAFAGAACEIASPAHRLLPWLSPDLPRDCHPRSQHRNNLKSEPTHFEYWGRKNIWFDLFIKNPIAARSRTFTLNWEVIPLMLCLGNKYKCRLIGFDNSLDTRNLLCVQTGNKHVPRWPKLDSSLCVKYKVLFWEYSISPCCLSCGPRGSSTAPYWRISPLLTAIGVRHHGTCGCIA